MYKTWSVGLMVNILVRELYSQPDNHPVDLEGRIMQSA
jgi:hypothetical protein